MAVKRNSVNQYRDARGSESYDASADVQSEDDRVTQLKVQMLYDVSGPCNDEQADIRHTQDGEYTPGGTSAEFAKLDTAYQDNPSMDAGTPAMPKYGARKRDRTPGIPT